ncbi:hypothetical protein PXD56_03975 [Maribacter sp. SA7]|uniref:hypothetical protein n=1 Tax=Maribacter zhoushanensis TaxID=3030012 RepID=UPI0023EB2461|nr:hypothetical protein [Maribacter zhoushanensis]MDF4202094.1 hypothetical protein [Maribacter zhoushanensis]
MEIVISILVFAGFITLLFWSLKFKTKSEKEYEKKLEESLADEYIIDPETGAKLTLEEAESGHWIAHNNEYRTIPESEINKIPTEQEKIAELGVNYLRKSKFFRRIELTEKELQLFAKSKILSKYDDWTYSNSFSFENGLLILPAPEIHGQTYYEDDYVESQIMCLLKTQNTEGHYYLREKSNAEKFFDKFRNDDELSLNNYECFTFKKSSDIILLNRLLESFKNQVGLEIEIINDNLFIKTTKLVNESDVKRIEKIIKNVG